MLIPGANGSRWRVRPSLTIDWDWWTVGVYWESQPDLIVIRATPLPPIWLVITETRTPRAGT